MQGFKLNHVSKRGPIGFVRIWELSRYANHYMALHFDSSGMYPGNLDKYTS